MRTSHLPSQRELARAALQVQGIKDHAELGKGMPYSIADIEAVVAALVDALARRHRLNGASLVATSRLGRTLKELAVRVQANVAYAASRLGPSSAELLDLGGRPRKRIVPSVDRTVDAPVEPTDAPHGTS